MQEGPQWVTPSSGVRDGLGGVWARGRPATRCLAEGPQLGRALDAFLACTGKHRGGMGWTPNPQPKKGV